MSDSNGSESNSNDESKSENSSSEKTNESSEDSDAVNDVEDSKKNKTKDHLNKFDNNKLVLTSAVEVNLNFNETHKKENFGKSLGAISFGYTNKPHPSKHQNLQGIKSISNQLDMMWNNFSSKIPIKPNLKPREIYECKKDSQKDIKPSAYNNFFKGNKHDKFNLENISKNTISVFDKQFNFEIQPNLEYFSKKEEDAIRVKLLEKENLKLKEEANKYHLSVVSNQNDKSKEKTGKKLKEKKDKKTKLINKIDEKEKLKLKNDLIDYARYKSNPKASNISRIRTVQDLYNNSTAIRQKQPIIFNSNTDYNNASNFQFNSKNTFENTYRNNLKFYTRKDYLNDNENDIDFDKRKYTVL